MNYWLGATAVMLGVALGASVGGLVGYKAGAYSAWRLVTWRLGRGA